LRRKTLLHKKTVLKMLVKLTPCVNFINVLQAAFEHADPKSVKKTDNLKVSFTLSGFACAKAAHRMLMKSTPYFM